MCFICMAASLARSYPASLPLLRLDRIYVRGFNVLHSEVHVGGAWQRLSDHAALSARLTRHDLVAGGMMPVI